MPETPPQRLPRLQNLRDVGGMPVTGGGAIRYGVLLRGDAPQHDDEAPVDVAWPPRTVIDLRAPEELHRAHPLAEAGTHVIALPLHDAANLVRMQQAKATELGLPQIYAELVGDAAHLLARAARIVAADPAPVLIHCAAGKDRTGITVAVLLDAVGVRREAVVADFVATEPNMKGVVARVVQGLGPDAVMDVDGFALRRPDLFTAPAEVIERVLADVDASHGGGAGLLRESGLTAAELEQLRGRLVDPAA